MNQYQKYTQKYADKFQNAEPLVRLGYILAGIVLLMLLKYLIPIMIIALIIIGIFFAVKYYRGDIVPNKKDEKTKKTKPKN